MALWTDRKKFKYTQTNTSKYRDPYLLCASCVLKKQHDSWNFHSSSTSCCNIAKPETNLYICDTLVRVNLIFKCNKFYNLNLDVWFTNKLNYNLSGLVTSLLSIAVRHLWCKKNFNVWCNSAWYVFIQTPGLVCVSNHEECFLLSLKV